MGGTDVLQGEADGRRARSDAAWVLLVALLVGLFAVTGASSSRAGAEAACADGSAPRSVALPSGAVEAICPPAAAAAAEPSIVLSKTVGVKASTCASTSTLKVASGTQVFYCYSVKNTGSVTVSVHDLQDDKLGALLTNYHQVLGPNASTFLTASATIGVDTTNVATWTASDGVNSASDTDSAIVDVTDEMNEPTNVVADVGEGSADLTWDAPTAIGKGPITGYVITPFVGAVAGTPTTLSSVATSGRVDGLVNGTTYTFKVAGVNAFQTGEQSAPSNAVTPRWWLPWSTGPIAVKEIFTWMTGKAPTSAESNSWLSQLNAGTKKPGDLVAALRAGTDATTNVDPTVRLYSAYLVRIPDASGLDFWLGRRRAGWTLSRISANFAASNEFKTRYGSLTNKAFVERIYENVLGRPGEASGVAYWTKQLDTKRKSRGQVMINFSESNEYKTKQVDKTQAAVAYIQLLGRAPSVAERDAFVASLGASTPLTTLVRQLIHTPAFAARAG